MPKRTRVNVRTLANTGAVRREKRNGRDVIIVPSATLPDDVVMNDVLYPADEIATSFKSLERTPAPLGHPMINGDWVSARDPEGINIGWVGAWNENVRQSQGKDGKNRVLIDKVIDVERANQSDDGKRVLAAINAGDPVHTSTGLLCMLEAANGDVEYSQIARQIEFDHDAILLDEEGAATPGQGVGMMVNAKGAREEVEVMNVELDTQLDQEIEWAVESLAYAIERKQQREENRPLLERIKSAILDALGASDGAETSQQNGDAGMADEKQLEELSAKVNALTESVGTIADGLKGLVEAQNAAAEKAKADAEAAKADLVNKVVVAKIDGMTEEVAKSMTAEALDVVLKMNAAKPKAAPLMAGGLPVTNADDGDTLAEFSPIGKVQ